MLEAITLKKNGNLFPFKIFGYNLLSSGYFIE